VPIYLPFSYRNQSDLLAPAITTMAPVSSKQQQEGGGTTNEAPPTRRAPSRTLSSESMESTEEIVHPLAGPMRVKKARKSSKVVPAKIKRTLSKERLVGGRDPDYHTVFYNDSSDEDECYAVKKRNPRRSTRSAAAAAAIQRTPSSDARAFEEHMARY